MDKLITRDAAYKLGQKTYYTGTLCKKGHDSYRYTNSGKCTECVKARAAQYRINNKDKVRKDSKKYRENNKEKIRNNKLEYRLRNKEYLREKNKRYYQDNKERILEVNKRYYENNRDKISSYQKKWRSENREYLLEEHRKYRKNNRSKLRKDAREYYNRNKSDIAEKDKIRYFEKRDERLSYAKRYRDDNKDRINDRNRKYRHREDIKEKRRKRDRYLRKNSPSRKVMDKCRHLIHRTLKATNKTKESPTYELLGYTPEELRSHIEKYMISGMNWENFGEYWCIDHRYPVSRMVDEGIYDPSIINSLYNLRPMLTIHNLSKWTKTEEEYFLMEPDIAQIYPEIPCLVVKR